MPGVSDGLTPSSPEPRGIDAAPEVSIPGAAGADQVPNRTTSPQGGDAAASTVGRALQRGCAWTDPPRVELHGAGDGDSVDPPVSTGGRSATRPTASGRRWFLAAAVAAGLATVLFVVWLVVRIGGARTTDALDDIGELVAALCAATACGVAARRAPSARQSWGLLAVSALAWGVGEFLWCYYDLVQKIEVPFPSWADAGFLAAVPPAFAALLVYPSSSRRAAYRLQSFFDGCIIATALLFASWATVLGPLYRSHQGNVFKQSVSLAYPASDVIMLTLVIIVLARAGGRGRVSLGLVMAGMAAFAVADSSFAYLTEVNTYGIGNYLDTGWVAGYFLIALGALWALVAPVPATEANQESTISIVAPYAPVLVVLVVTGVELMRGTRIEPVSWAMALAPVALVLGRELVRLWDAARHERSAAVWRARDDVSTAVLRGPAP
jgi:hypothetical protein